jgi:hypothetical protein
VPAYPAGGVLHGEEHLPPSHGGGLQVEQVAGHDPVRLGLEELLPGQARPAWRRVRTVRLQDRPHRRGTDPLTQARELAVDPAVPPGGLLHRQRPRGGVVVPGVGLPRSPAPAPRASHVRGLMCSGPAGRTAWMRRVPAPGPAACPVSGCMTCDAAHAHFCWPVGFRSRWSRWSSVTPGQPRSAGSTHTSCARSQPSRSNRPPTCGPDTNPDSFSDVATPAVVSSGEQDRQLRARRIDGWYGQERWSGARGLMVEKGGQGRGRTADLPISGVMSMGAVPQVRGGEMFRTCPPRAPSA